MTSSTSYYVSFTNITNRSSVQPENKKLSFSRDTWDLVGTPFLLCSLSNDMGQFRLAFMIPVHVKPQSRKLKRLMAILHSVVAAFLRFQFFPKWRYKKLDLTFLFIRAFSHCRSTAFRCDNDRRNTEEPFIVHLSRFRNVLSVYRKRIDNVYTCLKIRHSIKWAVKVAQHISKKSTERSTVLNFFYRTKYLAPCSVALSQTRSPGHNPSQWAQKRY